MRCTRSILVVCLLSLLVAAAWFLNRGPLTKSANASEASIEASEIAQSFNRLQLITAKPVLVSPEFAFFCIPTTQETVEREKERSGPHAHTAIRVYMNDRAADAFRTSATVYPVGSIVVKEKLAGGYMLDLQSPENTGARNGVGGMIKRAAGYALGHGDWEYFYAIDGSKVDSGRIASCVNCHEGAKESDHVFGTWSDRGKAAE